MSLSCNTNQHLRLSNLYKRLLNAFFTASLYVFYIYVFQVHIHSRPKFSFRKLEMQVLILQMCVT